MECITLPSGLVGFSNYKTEIVRTASDNEMYLLHGELKGNEDECICPLCGGRMHVHNRYETSLKHLSFGRQLSCLRFTKLRYFCPPCGYSCMQEVPFQAQGHRITCELHQCTKDLLAYGLTNKEVAYITGLGKNTVKDIDLQRLIQTERQARFLGIDEFKLHGGHKYAVIIIDMETGHVLWLAHGKKKASVHSFIEHVGV
jgi:transposase